MTTVAYLGPNGTFAEAALLTQPDLAAMQRLPLATVPQVLNAVERREADLGLIPIENAIEGSVTVTLDTLAFDTDLMIQREITHPVRMCLLAQPDAALGDIQRVRSIPIALAQVRRWMGANLPDVRFEATNSTASAAVDVGGDPTGATAAVGNALAAELLGLQILAEGIEDHPGNATRFVVVGRGIPAPSGHDKTSIVCMQRANRPGSLVAILLEFAARGIDLTNLASRPLKSSEGGAALGEYCFFIDLEGHIANEVVSDALLAVQAGPAQVKCLGSYPRLGEPDLDESRQQHQQWRDAQAWLRLLRSKVRDEPGPLARRPTTMITPDDAAQLDSEDSSEPSHAAPAGVAPVIDTTKESQK
ncbi:MAG: prephenate dehydratase [Actinobacteria bacterium]|nr:prephenate dehydratase [Actinomycetota bacterium]MCB9388646.1 prephenate dehydratase [Acidimicrobiia bacterium]